MKTSFFKVIAVGIFICSSSVSFAGGADTTYSCQFHAFAHGSRTPFYPSNEDAYASSSLDVYPVISQVGIAIPTPAMAQKFNGNWEFGRIDENGEEYISSFSRKYGMSEKDRVGYLVAASRELASGNDIINFEFIFNKEICGTTFGTAKVMPGLKGAQSATVNCSDKYRVKVECK